MEPMQGKRESEVQRMILFTSAIISTGKTGALLCPISRRHVLEKIADTSLTEQDSGLEEEEEYKKSIEIGPRAIVVLLGRQGGGERCDHGTRGCTSGPSRGISFW